MTEVAVHQRFFSVIARSKIDEVISLASEMRGLLRFARNDSRGMRQGEDS
jgi:hypothetical protein